MSDEISLDEFARLPEKRLAPTKFLCTCGKELPIRKITTCPCGLRWKKRKGFMFSRSKSGTWQVPT